MINVFIDGGAGTTGLKIHEHFSGRNDVTVLKIEDELRKDPKRRVEMISTADISFLCLPDDASRQIAAMAPADCRILDTSTAHRTDDNWVYGFPELCANQKNLIKNSNRVAVPGCHATGAISIIRPLVESGIAAPDYPFAITSLTGYSGGGKSMIADYEADGRSILHDSPAQYGLTQKHKHIPEIMKMTGIKYKPSFMPIVADYFSGMEVIVPLHGEFMTGGKKRIAEMYRDWYSGSVMVEYAESLNDGNFIYSNKESGSNRLKITVAGDDENIIVVALYDNLGKGASGAAIQNMNIMLGLKEDEGLV